MNIKEVIQDKIKKGERKDIVFIHPVISNEEIAKYISAFSNEDGGIVLFGVKDDGKNLWIKRSAFKIVEQEKAIRKMVDPNVKLTFGEFYQGNEHKLEYIYVEKNEETVCLKGDAFKINPIDNKPHLIKRVELFLSYCQKDSCIADIIEEKIGNTIPNVKISRDIRDVPYKGSFSAFMQSTSDHEYVIAIISDQYLRSRNCMFEMLETMRDRDFIDKLFYVVISKDDAKFYNDPTNTHIAADIYSINGQTSYIQHWKSVEEELLKEISELGNPLLIGNHTEELKIVKKIEIEIQDFMKILRDRKGIPFGDMLSSDFVDIITCIQNNNFI